MKRITWIIALLLFLTACSYVPVEDEAEPEKTPVQEEQAQSPVTPNEPEIPELPTTPEDPEIPEAPEIPEPFLSVLKNEVPLYTYDGDEEYFARLYDYTLGKFIDKECKYAFVDMNGDGRDELIVQGIDTVVMSDQGDRVFGFCVNFRQMISIQTNGVFHWTANAGYVRGASKYNTDWTHEQLYLEDLTEDPVYRVGEDEVTEEEFIRRSKEYDTSPVAYYPLDYGKILDSIRSELNFAHTSDSETLATAPRDQSCFPAEFEYKGMTVTVNAPAFTGIPTDTVYSYKKHYAFEYGLIEMRVDLEGGAKNILVDSSGRVVSADYNGGSLISDIVRIHTRGDLDLEMTGVPGEYKQQLFNKDGSPASEVFDGIGYFYNGIAPVESDGKIGFIGDDGSTLLEPCIQYDDLRYPPDYEGYWFYYLTEDSIVLPIDGEFAVITLTRE